MSTETMLSYVTYDALTDVVSEIRLDVWGNEHITQYTLGSR